MYKCQLGVQNKGEGATAVSSLNPPGRLALIYKSIMLFSQLTEIVYKALDDRLSLFTLILESEIIFKNQDHH